MIQVEKLLPAFEQDDRVLALYRLGSAANDTMRPDSDIDLAVLARPGNEERKEILDAYRT